MPALLPDSTPTPQLHVLPPPSATSAIPAKRPGKLSLGGIAKAADTKPGAKVYPTAVLDDEQRATVSALLEQKAQADALEGSIKALSDELKGLVLPQWFTLAQGQLEPPSSMLVPGEGTDLGMFVIAGDTGGRYMGTTDENAIARLAGLVGDDAYAEHFMEKTTLKIEMDKVAEDKQQALVNELLGVFERHGASHAVSAKQLVTFKPLSRKARFHAFPIDVNIGIQSLLPITPSFKRKA